MKQRYELHMGDKCVPECNLNGSVKTVTIPQWLFRHSFL